MTVDHYIQAITVQRAPCAVPPDMRVEGGSKNGRGAFSLKNSPYKVAWPKGIYLLHGQPWQLYCMSNCFQVETCFKTPQMDTVSISRQLPAMFDPAPNRQDN